jgi:hypothetical protein
LNNATTSTPPIQELTAAFPAACAQSIAAVVPNLSWQTEHASVGGSRLVLGAELLRIPKRIYFDPMTLNERGRTAPDATNLICWYFTRHHDGRVRERCLREVIEAAVPWGPAFVLLLLGEYVVEILEVIREHVPAIDEAGYRDFLRQNHRFYETTRSRVMSYWNCYYRHYPRSRYPGFLVLDALDALISFAK